MPATVLGRSAFYPVYEQLMRVHQAANAFLKDPLLFADPDLARTTVASWLARFSLPPEIDVDGAVPAIVGGVVTPTPTELLTELMRVVFPPAAS